MVLQYTSYNTKELIANEHSSNYAKNTAVG